jgi:hypothetical protein
VEKAMSEAYARGDRVRYYNIDGKPCVGRIVNELYDGDQHGTIYQIRDEEDDERESDYVLPEEIIDFAE